MALLSEEVEPRSQITCTENFVKFERISFGDMLAERTILLQYFTPIRGREGGEIILNIAVWTASRVNQPRTLVQPGCVEKQRRRVVFKYKQPLTAGASTLEQWVETYAGRVGTPCPKDSSSLGARAVV